jgi:hypothetical protein
MYKTLSLIATARDSYKRIAPDPTHWPVAYQKIIEMQRSQPHFSVADLGAIKAQTLIMAGEFDCIKPEHTDQLARAIPGGGRKSSRAQRMRHRSCNLMSSTRIF